MTSLRLHHSIGQLPNGDLVVTRGGPGGESMRRGSPSPGRGRELGGRSSRLAKLQTARGRAQPSGLEGGGDRVRPDMEATGRLGARATGHQGKILGWF